jgi:hypothetical protein
LPKQVLDEIFYPSNSEGLSALNLGLNLRFMVLNCGFSGLK